MKNLNYSLFWRVIALLMFIPFLNSCDKKETSTVNKIWYTIPAQKWDHALPVGNGRMGAMVFGNPKNERIQLNEDSMWPGGPDWGDTFGKPEDLAEIRSMVCKGKVHEADKAIVERFSKKGVKRSHQTMGDLFIDYPDKKIENYKRELNLDSAVVTTRFTADGSLIKQEVFCSAPDNILVINISSTDPNGTDLEIRLNRPEDHGHKTVSVKATGQQLIMDGEVTQQGAVCEVPKPLDYGVKFRTIAKVINKGGSVEANDGKLLLKGINSVRIILACSSSYYSADYQKQVEKTILNTQEKNYKSLLSNHVVDYQSLYKRLNFDLGGHELDSLATNLRLEKIKAGGEDPDLVTKMFQYGRYLLISSSRPNTNPANLQGIWNEHIEAPWNADYHLNINLQMNYWPAEVGNLSECHKPLIDYIDRLIERGKITAKQQYNCRGSVIHHSSDLWAPTWMRANQPYWGSWIHGGGWLMQDIWRYYEFTGDKEFLKNQGYPALKQIALFYLDWVQKDKNNEWVSFPSTSPENSYIAADGEKAAVTMGNAMGQQIINEVFSNVLEAAKELQVNDDFVKEVKSKLANLRSGLKIGEDGRILEWDKPYEEPEKGHRHMSHLYALHPANAITPEGTPALFKAAHKSLDYRLEHGGAGTGWSRAWLINFSARLLDGEMAKENIDMFFKRSTEINLFDMHPPFQIDGNFGFTAGVSEMLLQSQNKELEILPALPKAWQNGKISGLLARGGFEVDITWKEGKLSALSVRSNLGNKCKVKYNRKIVEFETKEGQVYHFDDQLNMLK